jgi:very-short-patch-repair endonuclease
LLRFLAETVHPEVRAHADDCLALVARYNAHLRVDGVELWPKSYISGRPVYAWRRAVAPVPTPMKIQDAIAEVIWERLSATRVAEYCEGLGLGPPHDQYDNPMASKRGYVRNHTKGMTVNELLTVGRKVLADFEDATLRALVEAAESGSGGVGGRLKNLIFAADGPKPELVLRDAINNDIEITEHAKHCLVYDRPLSESGLTWRDLVEWWRQDHPAPTEREVALDLHKRLLRSLSPNSPGEALLFRTYASLYRTEGFDLPALIPQVYLHLDPRARRTTTGPLVRQRMDFLMLLPNRQRVVIEVDGQHHYSEDDKPAPALYAQMAREDRKLRLAGYEIYRFGAAEFVPSTATRMLMDFFVTLLRQHRIEITGSAAER